MKQYNLRVSALIIFSLAFSGSAMAQWTQLVSGTSKPLHGVFSVSASMTVACGDDGLVLGTTNGGMSFSSATASTTENLNKIFVSGVALPTITVVGDNGVIRSSTNLGATWNSHTAGTTENLNDLFVHDPTNGTTLTIVGDNGVILFSNNSGANYGLKLAPTNDPLNGVFFRDLLNGIIVGNSGVILRTTNGGAAWSTITSGVNTNLNHVFFTTMNDGWIVGDGGLIMNTTDGGLNWSSVTSPVNTDLARLSFSDMNNGTAVGAGGVIIRTTDGGVTWAQQNSGVTTDLHSVFFIDANNGMAVGEGGLILRTTNGGTPVELQSFSASRIARGSAHLQWTTATETDNYGFEVQRNIGASWEVRGFVNGAGSSTQRQDYSFVDTDLPSTRIAYRLKQVDMDGSASYSPVIELSSVSSSALQFSLDAWPQPTTNIGTLQLRLGESGHARVRIYDTNGRIVNELHDGYLSAGTHVLRWDATRLPAGAYLAVLESNGHRTQKTLILQK
ncbi:T9SS type A sorting domain-containing protein [bacterium]|nr:T9SS type A sorting domain-containing protein [bacterium]